MRHASSNATQIDGVKIVRPFANVVLVNAILLTERATVHQVDTDKNLAWTKITIYIKDIPVEIVKKHVLWVHME